ncbi:MAG: polysaccharide biosynthesis C-terminal domain-containing protein [bacterium]
MRLLKASLSVFLTHMLLQGVSVLPAVLISRRFGAEGKGLMALWLYVPAVLCALSSLGMGGAAQFFVSRKTDSPAEQLGNILLLPLLTAALVVVGFYLTYEWWRPHLEDISFARMIPALLILPTSLVQSHCSQLLISLGRVAQRNVVQVVQTTSSALLIAALILFPEVSVDQALWGYIVGFALGAALAFYFARIAAGGVRLPSGELTARSLAYGFWVYLSALVRLLAQRISFFLLVALSTLADAGVFSVCLTITSPLVTLPWSVQAVLFPVSAAQSEAEARLHTPRYLRQLLIVLVALAAGIIILSKPLLALFGSEFVVGQTALIILLLGVLLAGQNTIFTTFIQGRGKPVLTTVATAASFAVTLILSLLLIPRFGLLGGALATVVGQATIALISLGIYLRLAETSPLEIYRFRRGDLDVFRSIKSTLLEFVRRS